MTKRSSGVVEHMFGFHHKSLGIVMLKVGLYYRSSNVVQLKVGFHHGCLGSNQDIFWVVKLEMELHLGSLNVVEFLMGLHHRTVKVVEFLMELHYDSPKEGGASVEALPHGFSLSCKLIIFRCHNKV